MTNCMSFNFEQKTCNFYYETIKIVVFWWQRLFKALIIDVYRY